MTIPRQKLLVVDDDSEYCSALQRALSTDFDVTTASGITEARAHLGNDVAIVLIDVRLRIGENDRDGLDLLEAVHQAYPSLPVVMMTAYADIDLAVEAMRLGAVDFVSKARIDIREFRKVLDNALRHAALQRRLANREEELRRLEPWELVGSDPALAGVREMIDLAANDSHCTVMIRGETGTGKELVARAVHSRGSRKDMPFVALSIPSLPPELVSAALFGHTKGAYTDAKESRIGYIEQAQGGVLFLDEIGELHQDVQRALLRFLETRTFARIGSTTNITVDIQIVCATNKKLEDAIASREFREDLYYRLQSLVIWLPPLRERLSDLPLLVDHFLFLFRQQGRTAVAGISHAALQKLSNYAFPGNVRELKSIIERAMMLATVHKNLLIEVADLPAEVVSSSASQSYPVMVTINEGGIDLDQMLALTELNCVEEALRSSQSRKTDAWKLLGLNDRFALRRRVKRIAEAYPHLMGRFPTVQNLYGE